MNRSAQRSALILAQLVTRLTGAEMAIHMMDLWSTPPQCRSAARVQCEDANETMRLGKGERSVDARLSRSRMGIART
jgi:hypothetical protein